MRDPRTEREVGPRPVIGLREETQGTPTTPQLHGIEYGVYFNIRHQMPVSSSTVFGHCDRFERRWRRTFKPRVALMTRH